jgi:hypothetical protein
VSQTLRAMLVEQLLEAPVEKLPGVAEFFAEVLPPPRSRGPPPESEPVSAEPPGPAQPLAATLEGDPASGFFCIRVAPVNGGIQAPAPAPQGPDLDPKSRTMAAKLMQLLTALDPDKHLRKAQPLKVFMLRFRHDRSRSQIAVTCKCSESLVAKRLSAILASVPWQPRQLREISAYVEAMEHAVSDSRARKIYRKGAVYGDEEEEKY